MLVSGAGCALHEYLLYSRDSRAVPLLLIPPGAAGTGKVKLKETEVQNLKNVSREQTARNAALQNELNESKRKVEAARRAKSSAEAAKSAAEGRTRQLEDKVAQLESR